MPIIGGLEPQGPAGCSRNPPILQQPGARGEASGRDGAWQAP
jgi:hypothetical protein